MLKFIRILLFKPVLWAAKKFSSAPKRQRVFASLTRLYNTIIKQPGEKGLLLAATTSDRFIIFSDQHKGRKNGADDFKWAEQNYLTALDYYLQEGYTFINLGDSEELWENNIWQVKKKNQKNFKAEKKFLQEERYIKIFGNHDLYWDNDPLAAWQLKNIFEAKLKVYEGLVIQFKVDGRKSEVSEYGSERSTKDSRLNFLLTHGHQGDASSDGNWFSKFFVANIWAPLQAVLKINPNTPAYDAEKKTLHNTMMYEWSAEDNNPVLITGHTHQPVFASLTHLEKLYKQLQTAIVAKNDVEEIKLRSDILKLEKNFTAVAIDYMTMKPCYFNTGCCCYSDGDITGIEIADGDIKLIKWSVANGKQVLEKMSLVDL